MSVEILARIQFAFTIMFHYIFPPLSIGLGLVLMLMEGLWLKTGNDQYKKMTHFWVKIFALIFGVGVASGIVMEFQFGTNWATYSRYVGDIFGSALAAEGVFAFFLESGFLALLVFGWNRVSPKMHFFSTAMVWLGSTFSAIWIIVANSWMQTPAGYKIVMTPKGERANITDFWAMVFNPSSLDRLSHTVTAAWITAAFFVTSVSAFYLLKKRHVEFAKMSMKIGLSLALLATVLQLVTGHKSIVGVAKNQPTKMAALEGQSTTKPLDLTIFGYVDSEGEAQGIKIPKMGSILLSGNPDTAVKGAKNFDPEKEPMPPVQPVFQAYHLMVGIGMFLGALSIFASIKWWRGTLWDSKLVLTALVWAVVLPQLANQLGWFAAEVGRQPWIVYGMLRTSHALSVSVHAGQVLASLILFMLVYALLFALFVYLLDRKIKAGPEDESPELDTPNTWRPTPDMAEVKA